MFLFSLIEGHNAYYIERMIQKKYIEEEAHAMGAKE